MKLKVASYNVHRFVGTDGRCDVERVAEVVRQLEADVVALQEVPFDAGADAPRDLIAALPGYATFAAPVLRHDRVRHGNLLLTRLPIESAHRICLDFERREPRTALVLWLTTPARPLRVVATHLGLMPGERRYQVRLISSHLADEASAVTVLLGDFNEWFLFGRPLRWLKRRFGTSPSVRTFPSWLPVLVLDRVWVQPPSALKGCAAVRTRAARRASDHLPLVAELEL